MSPRPFRSVLIANRGEIVARVARAAHQRALRAIAIFSDADRGQPFVATCDDAVGIGGDTPATSYLNMDAVLDAARLSGAEAIHPGYGFLSENAAFAQAVLDAGLVWIGPPPAAIYAMGDKAAARIRAAQLGAPVLAGYDGADQAPAKLKKEAARIGFPLMIKAVAGGGGRGIRRVDRTEDFISALTAAQSEAQGAFGDSRVLLERAVVSARHVEVQVLADAHGGVVHLGERDCSLQRRRQKVIEEAPAPGLSAQIRAAMGAAAVKLAAGIGYVGAGTVEFLLDPEGHFTFMEMNTRLQVEHPVTEAVTGVDLVDAQLRIAMGEPLWFGQSDVVLRGHAIEARLCAEDPEAGDAPAAGAIFAWRPPRGARCDHALGPGAQASPFYDSMLAKIIVAAGDRAGAIAALDAALDDTLLHGPPTNRAFLRRLLALPAFARGEVEIGLLDKPEAQAARAPAPISAETLALAAWLAAQAGAEQVAPDWRGFSSAAALPKPVRLIVRDRTIEARIADDQVEMDGVVHTVDVAARRGAQTIAQDQLFLTLAGGDDLRFEIASLKPKAAAGVAGGLGPIAARLNGRVSRIEVQAGEVVGPGQSLVVLEAMKMEHAATAPARARVAAIEVVAGEQVAPGRVLVVLEPAS
jgi:geranyl-CoA carboxylase alpha subunit